MPKLERRMFMSCMFTTVSHVKSANGLYPGSPTWNPKLAFNRLKSVTLITLSLLMSPARKNPASSCVVEAPPGMPTVPPFARYLGPFTRQLYVAAGRLETFTVKNPEASGVVGG